MHVGDPVVALDQITETLGDGSDYVHAYPGEIGEVVDVTTYPETISVRFFETDTVSIVHVEEVQKLTRSKITQITDHKRPEGS